MPPDNGLKALIASVKKLDSAQQLRVQRLVDILLSPAIASAVTPDPLITAGFLTRFGEVLSYHHDVSAEPFTKDKFEHALTGVLTDEDHSAALAPKGNPGFDVIVNGERWSLKTQADAGIRGDTLHISKFMELGRGRWETEADLPGLRDRMLEHMKRYDRIFQLRCFRTKGIKPEYNYELVEIPKSLLQRAATGVFTMKHESKQNPKPGYCTVSDNGRTLFQLYFDGGTERKLQIKGLLKSECRVLATWLVRPV